MRHHEFCMQCVTMRTWEFFFVSSLEEECRSDQSEPWVLDHMLRVICRFRNGFIYSKEELVKHGSVL